METKQTGWRAVPTALLVAFALPIAWAIARVVIMLGWQPEHGFSPRVILAGEGIGFACVVLALGGMLELVRRATGRDALAYKVALAGIVVALGVDVIVGFVQFSSQPWEHQWMWKVYEYSATTAWLVFAAGLVMALPAERRVIGVVGIVVTILTWPIEPLREPLFGWMKLEYKAAILFESGLRIVRYGMFAALAILASRGVTTTDRFSAASGFRLAARGLWLRVIAAVAVVLLTLMMIGSRSGGGLEAFKLAMMAQSVVGVIALLLVGVGALRAAGSGVPELGRVTLVLGGGASLWAAGATLAQLPYRYKMFYKGLRDEYSMSGSMDWLQALETAVPVIVIVGVALLATALSGFGARAGNEDLRGEAQGKGIGFVALMLVALAIQLWMLPKATSVGNFAMLSLLAAAAGLWATVLMARLLARGAEVLEAEPGLPPASIVNASGT